MIVPRGEKLLGQRAREGKNETEERIHRDREKEAKMIYVGEGGREREGAAAPLGFEGSQERVCWEMEES